VSDARGVRTLHLGGDAIQSAMRLADPYALALDYTRCMMAFLLFHPEPREALMIGLGSLLGRFTIGAAADRLGRLPSLAAMYAGMGAMLILWWAGSAYWLLALFALAFGMCYGGYVALLPTIVMDRYGPRAVSGIIGFLYTGAGVGSLLGPWLAGAAFDALGAYDLPILAGAACAFLAVACILSLEKDQARHRGQ